RVKASSENSITRRGISKSVSTTGLRRKRSRGGKTAVIIRRKRNGESHGWAWPESANRLQWDAASGAAMRVDSSTGWVSGIRHCPSPNFNARPQGEISLLVIHNISLPPGQFGTGKVRECFTNCLRADEHPYFSEICQLQVSAHFLIERDGGITQFVSCLERAWHAGVSCFEGRENCNDFSLGIELEGTDELPYADAQYDALVELVGLLQGA